MAHHPDPQVTLSSLKSHTSSSNSATLLPRLSNFFSQNQQSGPQDSPIFSMTSRHLNSNPLFFNESGLTPKLKMSVTKSNFTDGFRTTRESIISIRGNNEQNTITADPSVEDSPSLKPKLKRNFSSQTLLSRYSNLQASYDQDKERKYRIKLNLKVNDDRALSCRTSMVTESNLDATSPLKKFDQTDYEDESPMSPALTRTPSVAHSAGSNTPKRKLIGRSHSRSKFSVDVKERDPKDIAAKANWLKRSETILIATMDKSHQVPKILSVNTEGDSYERLHVDLLNSRKNSVTNSERPMRLPNLACQTEPDSFAARTERLERANSIRDSLGSEEDPYSNSHILPKPTHKSHKSLQIPLSGPSSTSSPSSSNVSPLLKSAIKTAVKEGEMVKPSTFRKRHGSVSGREREPGFLPEDMEERVDTMQTEQNQNFFKRNGVKFFEMNPNIGNLQKYIEDQQKDFLEEKKKQIRASTNQAKKAKPVNDQTPLIVSFRDKIGTIIIQPNYMQKFGSMSFTELWSGRNKSTYLQNASKELPVYRMMNPETTATIFRPENKQNKVFLQNRINANKNEMSADQMLSGEQLKNISSKLLKKVSESVAKAELQKQNPGQKKLKKEKSKERGLNPNMQVPEQEDAEIKTEI